MPNVRTVVLGAFAGLAVALYLLLWFHWPTTISIAIGVLAAALALMTSVSLGADPAEADAAWRAAAPDLIDRPLGPRDASTAAGESGSGETEATGRT